jgi:hypothetical protein
LQLTTGQDRNGDFVRHGIFAGTDALDRQSCAAILCGNAADTNARVFGSSNLALGNGIFKFARKKPCCGVPAHGTERRSSRHRRYGRILAEKPDHGWSVDRELG